MCEFAYTGFGLLILFSGLAVAFGVVVDIVVVVFG